MSEPQLKRCMWCVVKLGPDDGLEACALCLHARAGPETDARELRAENKSLRSDNERLRDELELAHGARVSAANGKHLLAREQVDLRADNERLKREREVFVVALRSTFYLPEFTLTPYCSRCRLPVRKHSPDTCEVAAALSLVGGEG